MSYPFYYQRADEDKSPSFDIPVGYDDLRQALHWVWTNIDARVDDAIISRKLIDVFCRYPKIIIFNGMVAQYNWVDHVHNGVLMTKDGPPRKYWTVYPKWNSE